MAKTDSRNDVRLTAENNSALAKTKKQIDGALTIVALANQAIKRGLPLVRKKLNLK